jgi:hypothetical protein
VRPLEPGRTVLGGWRHIVFAPGIRSPLHVIPAAGGAPRQATTLDAGRKEVTENSFFPFWSPDSRSIGFWANAQVSRVDAAGGPPQLLCNTANLFAGGNSAGYWAPDGSIYFSGGGRGIFRVPQSGGEAIHVMQPDRDKGERSQFYPLLLPDGKRLLYHGQHANRDEAGVVLYSFEGKQKTRLAPSPYSFGYAPPLGRGNPGHLLYVRQNTLIAQPVDAKTMAHAGDVFPVVDIVSVSNTYARFAVSPPASLPIAPASRAPPASWSGTTAPARLWRRSEIQPIISTLRSPATERGWCRRKPIRRPANATCGSWTSAGPSPCVSRSSRPRARWGYGRPTGAGSRLPCASAAVAIRSI